VAVGPGREQRVDVGQRAAVLELDGAPVVVVLAAGHQPGQRRGAIIGEGQGFELLDVHRRHRIAADPDGRAGRAARSSRRRFPRAPAAARSTVAPCLARSPCSRPSSR
jgi:hypothetical protein